MIFFIKKVCEKATIQSSKGESLTKLTIVLTSKECRSSDYGTHAVDQDYVIDLLGDRADKFNLAEGTWIVGDLGFSARENNGSFYPQINLTRYCQL